MAIAMNPEPEYTRHERFLAYTEMLRERFDSGCLRELQDLTQWVVWRAEIEDGKPKKVPYNPHYYHIQARASVKIPKSWGTLADALTALQSGHFSGLGLMLTPPLVMIDLDHSFDRATQTITNPQAAEIVETLSSYTELSPSGTGLHILSYGNLPGKGIHTTVEMYGQDRFTTITTDHIAGTPQTIEHRQEALDALYQRFAPPVRETKNQNTRLGVGADAGSTLTELPPEAIHDVVLQRLLSGDSAGYKSPSNADFVLIMKLLHWTGDNVELTRQIFLASPLGQREKAERKTGETTYVDMTITNVLKKRRNLPMQR
jgi:primase-polymerase (primpol)-like protein